MYTTKGLKSRTHLLQGPLVHANPLLHHSHKDLKALAEKLDGHQLFEPIQARHGFRVQEAFICIPAPLQKQNIEPRWNKGI